MTTEKALRMYIDKINKAMKKRIIYPKPPPPT